MRRLCVYCGSSPGRYPEYGALAQALAQAMVRRGWGLVYGGASVGLMGVVADAVLEAGGEVIGVLPRGLARKEIAHTGLSRLHIVASMHERKAMMARLSDGFVALPGGLGTLEELFEMLTWGQLGLHQKPCGLLNGRAYYDALITFLDHAKEQAFLKPEHRAMVLCEDTPEGLLDRMASYAPPAVEKWLEEAET